MYWSDLRAFTNDATAATAMVADRAGRQVENNRHELLGDEYAELKSIVDLLHEQAHTQRLLSNKLMSLIAQVETKHRE